MDKFVTLSRTQRRNIVQKVSFDLGLRFDVVEKDIWVCYVLDKLFSLKELEGKLVFKGGTCLSKAYNLIGRFSEDVDITISKNCLEIGGTSIKTKEIRSRTRKAAEKFVQDKIYKVLNDAFAKDLKDGSWGLHFSEDDPANLFFQFPYSENITLWDVAKWDEGEWSDETDSYSYIKPSIKLEFGALGDDWPFEEKLVQPYAKKILPDFFSSTKVKVLDAKRNFLEKLLILHSICYRPLDKPLRHNYSRHYYDVFCLIKAGIGRDSLNLPDVLESVVKNKITFWNETWKPYDMIKSFSDIRVVPQNKARLKELETDYHNMKEMFFAQYPKFAEIIEELNNFEKVLYQIQF